MNLYQGILPLLKQASRTDALIRAGKLSIDSIKRIFSANGEALNLSLAKLQEPKAFQTPGGFRHYEPINPWSRGTQTQGDEALQQFSEILQANPKGLQYPGPKGTKAKVITSYPENISPDRLHPNMEAAEQAGQQSLTWAQNNPGEIAQNKQQAASALKSLRSSENSGQTLPDNLSRAQRAEFVQDSTKYRLPQNIHSDYRQWYETMKNPEFSVQAHHPEKTFFRGTSQRFPPEHYQGIPLEHQLNWQRHYLGTVPGFIGPNYHQLTRQVSGPLGVRSPMTRHEFSHGRIFTGSNNFRANLLKKLHPILKANPQLMSAIRQPSAKSTYDIIHEALAQLHAVSGNSRNAANFSSEYRGLAGQHMLQHPENAAAINQAYAHSREAGAIATQLGENYNASFTHNIPTPRYLP